MLPRPLPPTPRRPSPRRPTKSLIGSAKADYERELLRLQGELVQVQEWVKATGQRVVVVFEGRDAAGKGSTIKRVTEFLNPRVARIVALPMPTERQRTQWYFQRYIEQLPAAGEIVLFDRSWYNRAGVERVMGFCSPEEYRRFMHQCPEFERMLVEDGFLLRKYWFSVSDEEQERRFQSRVTRPAATVEVLAERPAHPRPLGGLLPGQGRDVRALRHPRGPVVRHRGRHQASRPAEHDRPPALHPALRARAGTPRCTSRCDRPPRTTSARPRELFQQVPDHAGRLLVTLDEENGPQARSTAPRRTPRSTAKKDAG